VPPSRRGPRLAKRTLRDGRRSDRLLSANSSTAPTTLTRTPCRGTGRERGRQTQHRHRARRRRRILAPPYSTCSHYLSRVVGTQMFMFPSLLAGAKDQPWPWRRSEDQPPSGWGNAALPSRRRIELGQPPSWRATSAQPRAGLVVPPGEEIPGALQDVSSRPRSLQRKLFDLSCLLTLIVFS
jgi:hypothetical protein